MNKVAVTGGTVSRRLPDHKSVLHCSPMAAQAVPLGNFPAFFGQRNRRRVIPQAFVIKVQQTRFGFIAESGKGARIRHVAFDAGERFMHGMLPFPMSIAHAVTARTEFRASRVMIAGCRQDGKNDPRENTGGKKGYRFPVCTHIRRSLLLYVGLC